MIRTLATAALPVAAIVLYYLALDNLVRDVSIRARGSTIFWSSVGMLLGAAGAVTFVLALLGLLDA